MTERNDDKMQSQPEESAAETMAAAPESPRTEGAPTARPEGGPPRREGGFRQGGPRREAGPRRDAGPGGGPGGRRPRKQYFRKRKVCRFCVERIDYIDYKKADVLQSFVQDRGKVLPRRLTGTCSQHQRWLITAIKRARNIALLPFAQEL